MISFTCSECGSTTRTEGCPTCHTWWDVGEHPLHYDRLGVAIPLAEYIELAEDPEYKRIGSTHVGKFWISTVWMGIDMGHGWLLDGRHLPIIFETMVFHRGGGPVDDEMRRYATEEAARQGHEETVQLVQELENANPSRTQARLDDL